MVIGQYRFNIYYIDLLDCNNDMPYFKNWTILFVTLIQSLVGL